MYSTSMAFCATHVNLFAIAVCLSAKCLSRWLIDYTRHAVTPPVLLTKIPVIDVTNVEYRFTTSHISAAECIAENGMVARNTHR